MMFKPTSEIINSLVEYTKSYSGFDKSEITNIIGKLMINDSQSEIHKNDLLNDDDLNVLFGFLIILRNLESKQAIENKKLLDEFKSNSTYTPPYLDVPNPHEDIPNLPPMPDTLDKRYYEKASSDSKRFGTKTYLMLDEVNGWVKIGKSKDPKYRERTLQSDKPSIKLIAICDEDIEKDLHDLYKEFRYRGEWFNLTEKHIDTMFELFSFKKVS